MSQHRATISWRGKDEDFLRGRYSREHTWSFDGGVVVPASPSPSVVRPPFSNPAAVDPEEAFVAAISSCHMLTFLYLASKQGFEVTAYDDEAVGTMAENERGAMWVSAVVLSPRIAYRGERVPSGEELRKLHEDAHHQCFISNSIKTEVTVA
jgi:organic hydroperoxide reductase OsmC/OhrA